MKPSPVPRALARWGLPLLALGLAWLALAAGFLTSGAGASWAEATCGLDYDPNTFGPAPVLFTLAFLGCALGSLAVLWALWRRGAQRPGRQLAMRLLGGILLYLLAMGMDPGFPLLRFLRGLFTSLELPAQMLVYLLPGILLGAALRRLQPEPRTRAGLAFLAGLAAMGIVRATQDGWGLFDLADGAVRIYATAAALGSYGLGLWPMGPSRPVTPPDSAR